IVFVDARRGIPNVHHGTVEAADHIQSILHYADAGMMAAGGHRRALPPMIRNRVVLLDGRGNKSELSGKAADHINPATQRGRYDLCALCWRRSLGHPGALVSRDADRNREADAHGDGRRAEKERYRTRNRHTQLYGKLPRASSSPD